MFGVDAMRKIELDVLDVITIQKSIPKDWHEVATEADRRDVKRARVTIALDADVVKFFKAMGSGYQPRMNRVLRAFMHMRLAKLIEGPDTTDYILKPEVVMKEARENWRGWGEMEAMMDEALADYEG